MCTLEEEGELLGIGDGRNQLEELLFGGVLRIGSEVSPEAEARTSEGSLPFESETLEGRAAALSCGAAHDGKDVLNDGNFGGGHVDLSGDTILQKARIRMQRG